jgi:hypothetical protein
LERHASGPTADGLITREFETSHAYDGRSASDGKDRGRAMWVQENRRQSIVSTGNNVVKQRLRLELAGAQSPGEVEKEVCERLTGGS